MTTVTNMSFGVPDLDGQLIVINNFKKTFRKHKAYTPREYIHPQKIHK